MMHWRIQESPLEPLTPQELRRRRGEKMRPIANLKDISLNCQKQQPQKRGPQQKKFWLVGNIVEDAPGQCHAASCRWTKLSNHILHKFLSVTAKSSLSGVSSRES
mmetsp:Transcript_26330/g.47242  ORF Transcript_26330/g.47242 Transcript_26330/m.47242 type:complete len:105 (-) Transcript_26330:388-702(-)